MGRISDGISGEGRLAVLEGRLHTHTYTHTHITHTSHRLPEMLRWVGVLEINGQRVITILILIIYGIKLSECLGNNNNNNNYRNIP